MEKRMTWDDRYGAGMTNLELNEAALTDLRNAELAEVPTPRERKKIIQETNQMDHEFRSSVFKSDLHRDQQPSEDLLNDELEHFDQLHVQPVEGGISAAGSSPQLRAENFDTQLFAQEQTDAEPLEALIFDSLEDQNAPDKVEPNIDIIEEVDEEEDDPAATTEDMLGTTQVVSKLLPLDLVKEDVKNMTARAATH